MLHKISVHCLSLSKAQCSTILFNTLSLCLPFSTWWVETKHLYSKSSPLSSPYYIPFTWPGYLNLLIQLLQSIFYHLFVGYLIFPCDPGHMPHFVQFHTTHFCFLGAFCIIFDLVLTLKPSFSIPILINIALKFFSSFPFFNSFLSIPHCLITFKICISYFHS